MHFIIATQFQVSQAGATGEEIVRDVEHMIPLAVGCSRQT